MSKRIFVIEYQTPEEVEKIILKIRREFYNIRKQEKVCQRKLKSQN